MRATFDLATQKATAHHAKSRRLSASLREGGADCSAEFFRELGALGVFARDDGEAETLAAWVEDAGDGAAQIRVDMHQRDADAASDVAKRHVDRVADEDGQ